ncbi:MAG: maleylpyruvate isomerase N-terminal domain-containing protein [Ilumatobacteraceae bacterium]
MADLAAYLRAQQATLAVVRPLPPEELDRTCAACPAWTIRDVVAHHIHFVGAFVDRSVPAAIYTALIGATDDERRRAAIARDEWTQAGVEARRGLDLHELVAEWDSITACMDDRGARALLDLTMHHGDIVESLTGASGSIDVEMTQDALTTYARHFLAPRLSAAGRALGLRCADTGEHLGPGDPAPTVSGTTYELLRTIGGRRTRAEADDRLDWGGTDEPTRDLFSVYGWPCHAAFPA